MSIAKDRAIQRGEPVFSDLAPLSFCSIMACPISNLASAKVFRNLANSMFQVSRLNWRFSSSFLTPRMAKWVASF
jgi:hypothetical protein